MGSRRGAERSVKIYIHAARLVTQVCLECLSLARALCPEQAEPGCSDAVTRIILKHQLNKYYTRVSLRGI